MYSKRFNFYDKHVDFSTYDNMSKHISKNALIVKEINITHMLNTTKFNIKNYRNRHKMRSR